LDTPAQLLMHTIQDQYILTEKLQKVFKDYPRLLDRCLEGLLRIAGTRMNLLEVVDHVAAVYGDMEFHLAPHELRELYLTFFVHNDMGRWVIDQRFPELVRNSQIGL
jgi:hypothetical protein